MDDSKLSFPKVVGIGIGAARKLRDAATETSERLLTDGGTRLKRKYASLQNALGENYSEVFETNPLVRDSISRSMLFDFGVPEAKSASWATAALWLAAAGSAVTNQRAIGKSAGALFHYGPGHVNRWTEVNQYMDAVAGSGHRLKYGHSLECLPGIVEQFGPEGVPAFFCHLLQDFTTVHGIPVVPNAWAIKQHLATLGMAPKTATALVSLSAANVLAGLMIGNAVWKLWSQWEADKRRRQLLSAAEAAALNRDYTGAIESYKRVLEMQRSPATLMAIGEVYLRRSATRPFAHRAFVDAVELLSSEPCRTLPWHGAEVSLRGIAGLQALATAEVIGDRYPQYWQEQVESLSRAAIHSFVTQAALFEEESTLAVGNPPLLSAALNRFLAAQTACQFPFLDDREVVVKKQLAAAVSLLARVGQRDEEKLRVPATTVARAWAYGTLSADEAEMMLATC